MYDTQDTVRPILLIHIRSSDRRMPIQSLFLPCIPPMKNRAFMLLPLAQIIAEIPAPQSGYLSEINAREIGEASVDLGAGRAKRGEAIDPAVGLIIYHKVGDERPNEQILQLKVASVFGLAVE